MKTYAVKSIESEMDSAIAGRSTQKTKGYIGSMLDFISQYANNLNTRAKAGFAVACFVAAGFGADYVLNREMPTSAEASQMPGIETPVDESRVAEPEREFPEPGREKRLETQRNALKLDWMSD